MTWNDIITGALFEIRVARAGESLAPETMALMLQYANELLDAWNAVPDRRAVFAEMTVDNALVPNLSPHTIGPAASAPTWTISGSRPISIEFAQVNILGGPPNVWRPVIMRDRQWYANKTIPLLTIQFPTDLYYEPSFPNGSLYFWPVPLINYTVRLWIRTLLSSIALGQAFSLPPGYESAIRLTLAEMAAPSFGQTVSPSTQQRAAGARENIFSNNDQTPPLTTADSGLSPGNDGPLPFNWYDRSSG